jgi:hypothetical protein
MITFNKIFTLWMESATLAVKTEAIRLVNGPLLHRDSGTLANSFFRKVFDNGHLGLVWNTAPHAYLWEFKGLGMPRKAPKGHPFEIIKRGALSPRSQKGIIFRTTIKPKSKYQKPVRFMRAALVREMTGTRGRVKYTKLGRDVGYAIVSRYATLLERKYGQVLTIRSNFRADLSS